MIVARRAQAHVPVLLLAAARRQQERRSRLLKATGRRGAGTWCHSISSAYESIGMETEKPREGRKHVLRSAFLIRPLAGGADRDRTDDRRTAVQALSQTGSQPHTQP